MSATNVILGREIHFFTNNIALQLKTSKKENRGMIQMAQRRPAGKNTFSKRLILTTI